jgi:hypothetical protein
MATFNVKTKPGCEQLYILGSAQAITTRFENQSTQACLTEELQQDAATSYPIF